MENEEKVFSMPSITTARGRKSIEKGKRQDPSKLTGQDRNGMPMPTPIIEGLEFATGQGTQQERGANLLCLVYGMSKFIEYLQKGKPFVVNGKRVVEEMSKLEPYFTDMDNWTDATTDKPTGATGAILKPKFEAWLKAQKVEQKS